MADPAAVNRAHCLRWIAVGIGLSALGSSTAGCSSGDAIVPAIAENGAGATGSAGASPDARDASVAAGPDAGGALTDAAASVSDSGSSTSLVDAGQFVPLDAGVRDANAREASALDANESDASSTDDVDAGPYGWGDRTDIEEIFSRYCFGCHGSTWQSCWSAQKNATTLNSVITSGSMPRNSTMSPMDKSALLAWLASGAPCVGPYQDAGNIVLPGGGATPGSL